MSTWLRTTVSRPAFALYAVVGALGAFVLGGYVRDWRQAVLDDASPQIAEPTRQAKKWKRKVVDRPVAVPAIDERELARLIAKYARPDLRIMPAPAGSTEAPSAPVTVLAETTDKRPAPEGVDVLTTIDRGGNVETTVVPRPVSFFGAPLKWRFYLEGGVENLTMEEWRAEAGVEFRLFRLGNFEIQPKVSAGYYPLPNQLTVEHDTRLFTGLRITFEP